MMGQGRIRVLLAYHGAALQPSRRIFEALAAREEIELRVLGPRRGLNPVRNVVLELPPRTRGTYELVSGRIYRGMRDFSGPYLTGLAGQIIRFRPHVVHVMNEPASDVHVQALIYRNLLRPAAKVLFFGFENYPGVPHGPRTDRRWRFVCRNSDGGAFASSEALSRVVGMGHPQGGCAVTHWGVPLDAFSPSRNDDLRQALGIRDRFVVGYVGRLLQEKGLGALLKALAMLDDHVHCLCVGDGPWREAMLALAAQLGVGHRLTLQDRVPDAQVPAYMNALDALVLPSETTATWKEQFGRVLAEGMACGVPVIGSTSGAIPEVIGDAGLLFPEGDSRSLAAVIDRLRRTPDLRNNLAALGATRAADCFSCTAFAGKLARLYTETAGRSS